MSGPAAKARPTARLIPRNGRLLRYRTRGLVFLNKALAFFQNEPLPPDLKRRDAVASCPYQRGYAPLCLHDEKIPYL